MVKFTSASKHQLNIWLVGKTISEDQNLRPGTIGQKRSLPSYMILNQRLSKEDITLLEENYHPCFHQIDPPNQLERELNQHQGTFGGTRCCKCLKFEQNTRFRSNPMGRATWMWRTWIDNVRSVHFFIQTDCRNQSL